MNRKYIYIFIWIFIITATISCEKNADYDLTAKIDSLTVTSYAAQIYGAYGGNTDEDLAHFVARRYFDSGICWSKNPEPTINDTVKHFEDGVAPFYVSIYPLEPATTYYVRMWVESRNTENYERKMYYTDEISFTTDNALPVFTDSRDNQEYTYTKIGNQVWMAENLNYDIPNYADYFKEVDNLHGARYDYETACEICPEGWHLPSDEEWMELERTIGIDEKQLDDFLDRGNNISPLLMEVGSEHWLPNPFGNDTYNFRAIPSDIGTTNAAHFWTSSTTIYWSKNAFVGRSIHQHLGGIQRFAVFDKNNRISVRCIKDSD